MCTPALVCAFCWRSTGLSLGSSGRLSAHAKVSAETTCHGAHSQTEDSVVQYKRNKRLSVETRKRIAMKTITAIYKGNRIIELNEGLELAENTIVLVVIPEQADEDEMRLQLATAAQSS